MDEGKIDGALVGIAEGIDEGKIDGGLVGIAEGMYGAEVGDLVGAKEREQGGLIFGLEVRGEEVEKPITQSTPFM
jgi:hypothetical protein